MPTSVPPNNSNPSVLRHHLPIFILIILASFWLMLPPAPAQAAGFTVNSTADGSDANPGNGICATNGGLCTLRAAIQEANASAGADTITLPVGTYPLTITGVAEDNASTGDLDITSEIALSGAGARLTTINGSSLSDRIFEIKVAGSLSLEGLTVSGGGVINYHGGAVFNAGTLTGIDVIFSGNAVTNTGGGAVYSTGATTLTRVAIFGNAALGGGGVEVAGGTTTLTNVTVSGNSSVYDGGGLRLGVGTLDVHYSTIANNIATNGSGGGLYTSAGTTANVSNSIFADNDSMYYGKDVVGTIVSGGYNIIEHNTGFSGTVGADILGSDPGLAALADDGSGTFTQAITPSSIAYNAGGGSAPATDQRGYSRVGQVDIGAYEYGATAGSNSLVVNVTTDAGDANPGDGLCQTATPGQCSLRAAIQEANALAGADTINFNISGSGPHTITPASALPDITGPVIIDGSSEPDFVTNGNRPIVVLAGTSAGLTSSGLTLGAGSSGSTIYGLVIGDWDGDGIKIQAASSNNLITGNYLGRLTTNGGDAGSGTENGDVGIKIYGANNTIGGSTTAERNVISGNSQSGIAMVGAGASGNQVVGNYIGTDATGTVALGNGNHGISIWQANNNLIGGTTAAARNVISGQTDAGIYIGDLSASGNVVQGNYIGTDAAGTSPLPNKWGIDIDGVNTTVGGTATGAGNVIAHNISMGVVINGVPAYTANGNTVLGNSIHSNGTGLGIDLNWDGMTTNDTDDSDSGANNLQNYPVLSSAVISGSQITIVGALTSTASATYTVEFFANSIQDTSGYGEGERFLGRTVISTTGAGLATFSETLTATVAITEFVSSTATDPTGNTSEFSANVAAEQILPEITVSPLSLNFGSQDVDAGATLSQTVVITNVGTADLAISSVSIVGSHFSIEADTGEGTLTPGATRTVRVSFDPTTIGLNNASLRLVSDDSDEGTVDVALSGTGTEVEPRVNFTAASQSAVEGTGLLTITAVLTKPYSQAVTLPFSLSGTATAGSGQDYTVTPSPLVFPPGSLTQTIIVTVTDDSWYEPTETIIVTIGSPTNAILGTVATHTITLTDDETAPTLDFSAASYTVGESGGTALITVTLSSASSQPITVTYATSNGTATAPDDYTALPAQTLTFTPGLTSRQVSITVTDDLWDELDETFQVTLSNPINATLAHNQVQLTLIDDDTITLALAKFSTPALITPTGTITYTIIVTNSGSTDLTSALISDPLPNNTHFVPGSMILNPPGAGSVGAAPPTLVNNLTITAGQHITVTFQVTVSTGTPPGTLVTNSATITSPAIRLPVSGVAINTVLADTPLLTVTRDSGATAGVGQATLFTFNLHHAPFSDQTPVSSVVISGTLGGSLNYAGGDTNSNSQLEAGEQWLYTKTYTPTPTTPNPLSYSVSATGQSQKLEAVTASTAFTTAVSGYDPRLFIDKDGPITATIGSTIVFTYTVINFNPLGAALFNLEMLSAQSLGDGSPLRNITVTDDFAGTAIYVSGDTNTNNQLDANEGWVYTATYTIPPTVSNPFYSTGTVRGNDPEGDLISLSDILRIDLGPGGAYQVYIPIVLRE